MRRGRNYTKKERNEGGRGKKKQGTHYTYEKSEEKGKERKKEGNREGRGKDLADKCTLEFCLRTFSFFLPRVKRGCKCLFLFIPT